MILDANHLQNCFDTQNRYNGFITFFLLLEGVLSDVLGVEQGGKSQLLCNLFMTLIPLYRHIGLMCGWRNAFSLNKHQKQVQVKKH